MKKSRRQRKDEAKNLARKEKYEKEAAELLERVSKFHMGDMTSLDDLGNISFAGEDLHDYAECGSRPKAHKMFLVKKHIRHVPKIFAAMPKVTEFKVRKLQTMLMLEIAREWTKRNIQREKDVQAHRKLTNPDDDFDAHGFAKLGYESMIIAATFLEADSYYDTSFVDLWLTALSIHETCDLNWSKHLGKCNKCNVEMTFATAMEDKGGQSWLTFVCPTCKASFSYSKQMYVNELLHMWAMNEYTNNDTFIMMDHFKKEHPGITKDHEYPNPIKGCQKCKEIHEGRQKKIKERDTLQRKYQQLFHQLFSVTNPFTGEVYAKQESPAASKAEELKAKRAKKKKGVK